MRDSTTVIVERRANKEIGRAVRSLNTDFGIDKENQSENIPSRQVPEFKKSSTGHLLKQLRHSSLGSTESILERLEQIQEECDFSYMTVNRLYAMLTEYGFNHHEITEALRSIKNPPRAAKEGSRKRMQEGLYKPRPYRQDNEDAELQKRLRLTTEKAATEFVLEMNNTSPTQRRKILKAVSDHVASFPNDRFIHADEVEVSTPTSNGIPTRRLPQTPGGTVPKALLTATMPFGTLFARPVNPKLSQGSVAQLRNPKKIATHEFSFEVTPDMLEERKGTKRPSQNGIVGMTATEKFTVMLNIAGEDFVLKDCVREEDGVLKFTDVEVEGVTIAPRERKRNREVMIHHTHTQGDGIGGPRVGIAAKENLSVGTPGSNFTLFAYLEAHIQSGKFFKEGHERLRITGEMDVYECDGDLYWVIPVKAMYNVTWGNGRSYSVPISPLEMSYPTYSCANLLGELIEIVRTPKQVPPLEFY